MCGLAIIASPLLSSCSLFGLPTKSNLRAESARAYQRGLLEGRAQETRRSFLEEQRERERPKPPPEVQYYRIPVPAHVDEDGVKIDAHSATIPVLEPQTLR